MISSTCIAILLWHCRVTASKTKKHRSALLGQKCALLSPTPCRRWNVCLYWLVEFKQLIYRILSNIPYGNIKSVAGLVTLIPLFRRMSAHTHGGRQKLILILWAYTPETSKIMNAWYFTIYLYLLHIAHDILCYFQSCSRKTQTYLWKKSR